MGTPSGRALRWDVLRTSYFNVQRTSVEDVSTGRPLALHRGPYGDVHRTSLGRNFAEWVELNQDFIG